MFFGLLALMLAMSGLAAAKAGMIQPIIDGFQSGNTDSSSLLMVCGAIAFVFGAQALFDWGQTIVAAKLSVRIVARIRSDLFAHLLDQTRSYFVHHPVAELSTRVVNDIAVFNFAAINGAAAFLRDGFTAVCLLVVMFMQDAHLASICLVIVFIGGFLLKYQMSRIQTETRRVQDSMGVVTRHIIEMIGGIEVVLSFGLQNRWTKRFDKTNRSYVDAELRAAKVAAGSVFAINLIATATIATIVWITGGALLRGDLSAGEFGAMLATLYLLQGPAVGIGRALGSIARGLAAGRRALEILEDKPEIKDAPQTLALPAQGGQIEFKDVSFAYGDEGILHSLSFCVRAGELAVLVGDSGAGKSTVAQLVQRFQDPTSGAILLDGVDLRQVARADLYGTVAYVPQDVFVFNESIEFNIRLGSEAATDAEVEEAVRIACLDEFVAGLPDGLATVVGDRGTRMSGGQRQRIAIARAAIAKTRLLILDEATSALDMAIEREILQNLIRARGDLTILAITHRLSIAEAADHVMVLERGRLVEEGVSADLLKSDGKYAHLHRAAGAKLLRHTSDAE